MHFQVPSSYKREQLHGNSSGLSHTENQSATDLEFIPAVPVDQLMHNLTAMQRHNSSLLSLIYDAYFNHDPQPPSSSSLSSSPPPPPAEKSPAHHHHSEDFPSAIDVLLIDAGGHDAVVIKGAKHLLRRHAIR